MPTTCTPAAVKCVRNRLRTRSHKIADAVRRSAANLGADHVIVGIDAEKRRAQRGRRRRYLRGGHERIILVRQATGLDERRPRACKLTVTTLSGLKPAPMTVERVPATMVVLLTASFGS